ncbi:hypothetical protein [Picrophilus oshimae]|uniref:EVE domain-containing protein n=1 Tax=Picrophilus torridus (strain ATCC 700027 / DSM 9790 / JCM 10055 / NBRC 100828 / KAW 2/3) TaxID=1122961 RepID=Q6L0X3_PICTO|nr:hypothetical protein [Picrophilus oshimae]AAT43379.1 hypothetical protein PTO0794 [Picrophilus oshimae DSM 9789]
MFGNNIDRDKFLEYAYTKDIMKITGPPCDWLKTYNLKSWGFRRYDKTERAYASFKKGDIFVFHSMKQEYLPADPGVKTGIIGIGILSCKKIIDNEPYDGAFTPEGYRPLKIYFSDVWFFGDTDKIINESIAEKKKKGIGYIMKDIYNLTKNIISFSEMRENDCVISTQGAVSKISPEKSKRLLKLIAGRLH